MLAVCLLLGGAGPVFAQNAIPLHAFAAPAQWVEVAEPRYEARQPLRALPEGSWVLLLDRQIDVSASGDAFYQHLAVKVLNATGVADNSQFDVSIDPTYQSLDIHTLRVVRDGAMIDQRQLARITALPQETDARNRIYNGRYNVNLLLSDVRPGDVVELAYTIHSEDKLFPGHFSARLDTGWSVPVDKQRIRVRAPQARALRYRLSDRGVVPEPQVRDGISEVVLEWDDLAPVALDAETPNWYYPWPHLQISDLPTWGAASRLVAPLYAPRPDGSARVADVVQQILEGGGAPETLALRALQYVQEEIRYTSISIGRGSHEPSDPDVVLERRFGDCKDKSLLLASILNRLGFDAQPVLVHSWRGRTLADALPTPYAFDHVVVRVRIGDDVHWLDPTAPKRHSPLSVVDPADFQLALTLNGSDDLESIPRPAPDTRHRQVRMVFDLSRGVEEPATLQMTTLYGGTLADQMRPLLERGSAQQFESDYAEYIARYYSGATPIAPMVVQDDPETNSLEVQERYVLERTFTPDEAGLLTFYLHADELYRYATPVASGARQSPIALEYPIEVHQHITVHLPEQWPIRPQTVTVENPAFRYRGDVRYAGRVLELSYAYQALADHVAPPALAQYRIDRERMYDNLGYVLSYNAGWGSGRVAIAPLPLLVLLASLALASWLAVRWGYRYDPEPASAPTDSPVGIRGWLLLPALGTALSPIVCAWIFFSLVPFIDADTWYALPSVVEPAFAGTAHLGLLTMVACSALLLAGSVLAAALFFTKRTSAPLAFVALTWSSIVFGVVMVVWLVLAGLDDETGLGRFAGESIRDVLIAAAWTLYMTTSRRVRATFVRRLPIKGAPGVRPLALAEAAGDGTKG